MTFLSTIELVNTWLLIWSEGHRTAACTTAAVQFVYRSFFAFVWLLTATLFFFFNPPGSDLFLTMMLHCMIFQVVGCGVVVRLVDFEDERPADLNSWLSCISSGASVALPTLLCFFLGPYALAFYLWPVLALLADLLVESDFPPQRIWGSVVGFVMALAVIL